MTNVDFDVELQKFSEFLALPESFEKVKEGKGADILFKILIFFSLFAILTLFKRSKGGSSLWHKELVWDCSRNLSL